MAKRHAMYHDVESLGVDSEYSSGRCKKEPVSRIIDSALGTSIPNVTILLYGVWSIDWILVYEKYTGIWN